MFSKNINGRVSHGVPKGRINPDKIKTGHYLLHVQLSARLY